jgi:hypothetical protein
MFSLPIYFFFSAQRRHKTSHASKGFQYSDTAGNSNDCTAIERGRWYSRCGQSIRTSIWRNRQASRIIERASRSQQRRRLKLASPNKCNFIHPHELSLSSFPLHILQCTTSQAILKKKIDCSLKQCYDARQVR